MKNRISYTIFLLLVGIIISSQTVYSQSAIGQLERMTGTKIVRGTVGSPLSSGSLNNMVAGALIQGVLSSLFSSKPADNQKAIEAKQQADEQAAQQAAEQQRIKEANDQAEYDKMMGSYKGLEDAQNLKLKTLDNTNPDFNNLNGDAEKLSSDARRQFEVSGDAPLSGPVAPVAATPFFGDAMPIEDIQTLVSLDNNPNVVDLREAKQFVSEKNVKDNEVIVSLLRQYEPEGNGEPIIQKPDCIKLSNQLKGYTNQRQQFQKTINLSSNELDVWETANRNAMINAAKDGLEYFTGQFLEGLTNRGKAADRLQQVYDSNLKKMTADGIDVVELQAKIEKLRTISSAGKIAELATNMNDWQTFIKDGASSLITNLSGLNDEIKGMLDDPKVSKYFETEKPELSTLLDISKLAASNMVFGKWVAKKIPVIGAIEISIKQAYNGLDYLLSLNRILKAQKINGGVMDAAKYIQKNIDRTYIALKDCPQAN
ncbi:MAG TPA: hypothetical protein VGK38_08945 [Prolixibacteraceae bacterium]